VCIGAVIGFCNLGDIIEHLIGLEKKVTNEASESDPEKCPAKTMLVLFVKGLLSNYLFLMLSLHLLICLEN